MIQDIGEHSFCNSYEPREATPTSKLIICAGDSLLVRESADSSEFALPSVQEFSFEAPSLRFLFSIDESDFFLAPELTEDELAQALQTRSDSGTPTYALRDMRWLRRATPRELVLAGAVGVQLVGWYRTNRFCSRCGAPLEHAPKSRELVCPACANIVYPKIAPGVIVGICDRTTERMVLTNYAGRLSSHYALVAGFAEIGETLEECVQREVKEEIGISVKNIRYYKSQPWPFSSSLLVGFFCELDSDPKLAVDGVELDRAFWVSADDPALLTDDRVSLTAEMMRLFAAKGTAVLDEDVSNVLGVNV